jgi:hypothetical protein
MKDIYKYIFFKMYHFCINVFKEEEFPWFFATGVVSILFTMSVIDLLSLVKYLMLPAEFESYGRFYGYFSLAVLIVAAVLVKRDNAYGRVLNDVKKFSKNKRERLLYLSFAYAFVVFGGLVYLSYLIRENT